MGTTDLASRLRAKFSRRRHSAAGSLASSTQSAAETSSVGSRHWDWHRTGNSRGHEDDPNPTDRPSRRAASQDPATRRGRSSQRRGHNNNFGTDGAPPDDQGEQQQQQQQNVGRHRRRHPEADDIAAAENEAPSVSVQPKTHSLESPEANAVSTTASTSSTNAVPPATTSSLTAADTAPDDPNNPLSPPAPRQSRAGLAPNDKLGNDLRRSWQAPPQPQPQSESQSRPNERPSPPHSLDLSPNSTPTRLRLRPSNPNLDRIHEDSSAERSSSPATPSDADADADVDPGAEARRHDDSLNSHHAPSTTSAALATPTVTFAPSLNLRPTAESSPSSSPRPPGPPRRQSLLSNRQSALIKTLLHTPPANDIAAEPSLLLPIDANMVTRKIWVRRPHASPTLITINEDDLVDDVRDLILRKYANSLGRTFDSPDLNIRICPRDQHKERLLGPEEPMGRTLDAYFPGGQTVEEALVIDIPRRAPKASPRIITHGGTVYHEDGRPSETGEGYFPHVNAVSPSHLPTAIPVVHGSSQAPHSIAVLGTGQIPPIPSPGGNRSTRSYRDRPERPRLGRTHTSSPTIVANGTSNAAGTHSTAHFNLRQPHHRTLSNSSEKSGMPPPDPAAVPAPPLPTPPAPEPTQARSKKNPEHPNLPPGMLNGTIPPINVLIVEDNPINLKLLEAFVKRLKVRWQTAMNGRDAVKKWRTGGFHLVLMDIQLPIMSGLDATREIRRLERVNSIGVFSSSPSSSVLEEKPGELKDQDRLENLGLFMSPVIIVALTASSLQSDRHEALAAGCNDFLTKPVNFVWLERKVMEWGCMQALIDFDGWRKWKVISKEAEEEEAAKKAALAAAKAKAKKNKQQALSSSAS
ncbi:hypothetical protein B0T10DRAFT_562341 [Thelonectria olida]|uniref:Response regulatory domain-containing protein n=1 Tax=Thelonectria olida TaxID=1576542 RepID=A0A9P9AP10_9HYPO|nr:hypothetical protein B0T10DRAFT_562341 [Thelonectria olida]